MKPWESLAAAQGLVTREDSRTAGLWPRAAALLARRALEGGMDFLYQQRAPALRRCSARAKVLCLRRFVPLEVAQSAQFTWHALSAACHHHPYQLAPDSRQLMAAIGEVTRLLDAISEVAVRR